jgi:23S rRNA (pseudouridine1915-N3)-methyltransferase
VLTVRILVVGRTKVSFLREGEAFYLSRIKRYCRTDWVEIKPAPPALPARDAMESEGEAILRRLLPRDYPICLDRTGRAYDSPGLAELMERISLESSSICFITGGSLGLSEGVIKVCRERISVSNMTLTHEMIRLVLLEQIYRAFTILKGEKYHK